MDEKKKKANEIVNEAINVAKATMEQAMKDGKKFVVLVSGCAGLRASV
jgi:hypothetical protein